MKARALVFVVLSVLSSVTLGAAGDYSPYSKISFLFVEGGDESPVATLRFTTNIPDSYKNESCLSHYITIDLSTEKGKSMYALALAARMADKEIRVTLPFCTGSRPLVHAINL